MATESIANRLKHAVHWSQDPSHVPLRRTPEYSIMIGALPPHDKTLLHSHLYPSICLALITTHGILNHVVSDPVLAEQSPSPVSIEQGTILTYEATPDNPHIHEYASSDHPSLFLGIETPLARLTGPPTPQLATDLLPGVIATHSLQELPFGSAVTLAIQDGSTVRLHVNASNGDRLLIRLIVVLAGPPIHLLDVRTAPDVSVERLTYEKSDPPSQIYLLSGFSSARDAAEATTISNATKATATIAIIDTFANEDLAVGKPQ